MAADVRYLTSRGHNFSKANEFIRGEFHLAGESVEMLNRRSQEFLDPGIRRILEGAEGGLGDVSGSGMT